MTTLSRLGLKQLVSRIFRVGSKTKNRPLLHKAFRKPKSRARINKDTNLKQKNTNLKQLLRIANVVGILWIIGSTIYLGQKNLNFLNLNFLNDSQPIKIQK